MPQKTLDEARVDEIRRFAAKHCGLEIHPNANKATAMQRLSAVWGRPYIEVSEEDVVQASEEIRQAAVPEGRKPEDAWYKIKIARSDRTNEDQFVPVGVNGRMLLIPRGEEVEIRAPYLEVLRRAIEHRYEQKDDEGNMDLITIPLYPLEYVGEPFFKDEAQAA